MGAIAAPGRHVGAPELSLISRLGGPGAVGVLVDRARERIDGDPELGPSTGGLLAASLVVAALGGPAADEPHPSEPATSATAATAARLARHLADAASLLGASPTLAAAVGDAVRVALTDSRPCKDRGRSPAGPTS